MRRIWIVFIALVSLAASTDGAQARRIRFPIAIPGLGASQTLVKVLTLPRAPEFRRDDGTYIDLGYLWDTDGTGEWVGYIGTGSQYLKLKPDMMPVLLAAANLQTLPPVPERPTQYGWLIGSVLLGAAICWKISARRRHARSDQGADPQPTTGPAEARLPKTAEPEWAKRAETAIAAAARQAPGPAAGVRPAPRLPYSSGATGHRATFGRR